MTQRRTIALQMLTLASLDRQVEPFKLSELSQITGRTRYSLMGDIERGDLKAFQFTNRPGSAWLVWPADARDWLQRVQDRTEQLRKPVYSSHTDSQVSLHTTRYGPVTSYVTPASHAYGALSLLHHQRL